MKVALKNVRLAFPALFEAKTVNGEGEPAFSACFLFGTDHPAAATLRAVFEVIGAEKWGAKWPVVKKELELKDRTALHDGDTKGDYSGFAGQLFTSARVKTRPLVVDRDLSALTAVDGKPYAGCYVNASVEIWAQDNNYGKRLNASLRQVQFLTDGEPFAGGGASSECDFEAIAETADDLV